MPWLYSVINTRAVFVVNTYNSKAYKIIIVWFSQTQATRQARYGHTEIISYMDNIDVMPITLSFRFTYIVQWLSKACAMTFTHLQLEKKAILLSTNVYRDQRLCVCLLGRGGGGVRVCANKQTASFHNNSNWTKQWAFQSPWISPTFYNLCRRVAKKLGTPYIFQTWTHKESHCLNSLICFFYSVNKCAWLSLDTVTPQWISKEMGRTNSS